MIQKFSFAIQQPYLLPTLIQSLKSEKKRLPSEENAYLC